jgi:hypothetical membrane protein
MIGLSLQLVATFDEVYGTLHFLVSALFFVALAFASISYIIEKKSILALTSLIIGSVSWVLYGLEICNTGIAVPEIISSIAVTAWIMPSALRIYFDEANRK